jgi:hypothetical protein
MVHATQDFAAARLADRIAKGLGTPYNTASALVLSLQCQVVAAEEFIRLSGVRVIVHPRG